MRLLVALGMSAVLMTAGACRSKAAPVTPAPPAAAVPAPLATPAPPAPPPADAAPSVELTEEERFARMTIEELNQSRPLGDVYFAYDSTTLDAEATATIDRNAAWLRRWTSTRVRIEGHADERGTSEYNLALSSQRATTVRQYLTSLGIAADRLTIVGYGEEQPTCTDATEGCWRQNRRGAHQIVAK
jgi:peptidoglycan-associated lipoprotein